MRPVTPGEALESDSRTNRGPSDEERPISEALDHILSQEVLSPIQIPGFDNSAVDGYAVRAADVVEREELAVVGEVRAGGAST